MRTIMFALLVMLNLGGCCHDWQTHYPPQPYPRRVRVVFHAPRPYPYWRGPVVFPPYSTLRPPYLPPIYYRQLRPRVVVVPPPSSEAMLFNYQRAVRYWQQRVEQERARARLGQSVVTPPAPVPSPPPGSATQPVIPSITVVPLTSLPPALSPPPPYTAPKMITEPKVEKSPNNGSEEVNGEEKDCLEAKKTICGSQSLDLCLPRLFENDLLTCSGYYQHKADKEQDSSRQYDAALSISFLNELRKRTTDPTRVATISETINNFVKKYHVPPSLLQKTLP